MKIFLICKNVDSGYRVECAYIDKDRAERNCMQMNTAFAEAAEYSSPMGSKYNKHLDRFFVKECEVIE